MFYVYTNLAAFGFAQCKQTMLLWCSSSVQTTVLYLSKSISGNPPKGSNQQDPVAPEIVKDILKNSNRSHHADVSPICNKIEKCAKCKLYVAEAPVIPSYADRLKTYFEARNRIFCETVSIPKKRSVRIRKYYKDIKDLRRLFISEKFGKNNDRRRYDTVSLLNKKEQ